MFSSLKKAQKISICILLLFSLALFAIGCIMFSLMENKNTAIAVMVTGSVMCIVTSILWIIFSKWFSLEKERRI